MGKLAKHCSLGIPRPGGGALRRAGALCTCVSALLLLLLPFGAKAQELSPEISLDRMFEKSNLMVAISAANWRPGICMAAAQLQTGKSVSLSLDLSKHQNYTFIATADSEAADLDLILRSSDGKIITRDTEKDGTPILEFRVPESGEYQLQLHLPASDRSLNFVSLSMLQTGGRQILEADYRLLKERFFTTIKDIFSTAPDLRWRSAPNQWCLFGYSLASKQGFTIRKLGLGIGQRYIAAAGTNEFQNIDLYLADAKNNIVVVDKAPDAFPLLEFTSPGSGPYDLRIEVERSSAPGLILLGIFQQ